MEIKKSIKPTKFKVILTIIITLLADLWFYFYVFAGPGRCIYPEECALQSRWSDLIIFTLIALLISYLLSCLFVWLYKK